MTTSARFSTITPTILAIALLSMTSAASAQVCYSPPFGNPNLADGWGCSGDCGGFWRNNPHRGLDFPEPCGTPIPAVADGTVVMNTSSGCLGYLVVIAHDDGMFSGYNHMPYASPYGVGARVARGQTIGVVGEAGSCAFGCHLHLTIDYTADGNWSGYYADVQVDPWSYIQSHRECRPDRDHDGSYEGDDCDDADPHRRPGLAESCDAVDNDCDTRVDESVSRECGSNVGACRIGTETCDAGIWGACLGGVMATDESCDTLDNDCDDATDEERICDDDDASSAAIAIGGSSDVDGDGRTDACIRGPAGFECLLAGTASFPHVVRGPIMADERGWDGRAFYTSVRMGDVDGDGRDDVCARDGEQIVCWGGSAAGFARTVLSAPIGDVSPEARTAELWLADVTGDGDADVCVRDVDGLRCQPRVGAAVALDALSDEEGWADVTRHGSIRFGDIDGDGDDDVCARGARGLTCWRADPTGFGDAFAGPTWSDALGWSEPRYGSTIRLVDVDGDHRADACGRGPNGFECWLSRTRPFHTRIQGPPMHDESWDARSVYATLHMGDVDGDGALDLCARTPEGVGCWLFDEDAFDRQILGPPLTDAEGWDAAARYGSIRLGDVNGDHRADYCARAASGMHCWISNGASFPRLWVAPSWSDAVGLSDPAFASSLTLAGMGARSSNAIVGGWSCRVGAGRSMRGAWALLALVLGLVIRRRRSIAALFVLLAMTTAAPAQAQTVADVIPRMGPCQAGLVAGLSQQLLSAQICAYPGTLVPFSDPNITIVSGRAYGTPEMVHALTSVAAHTRLRVTDTYRTVVEQYAYVATDSPGNADGCWSPAAVGTSRHEWGNAVDLESAYDRAAAMRAGGFVWWGPDGIGPESDDVHFTTGPERRGLDVLVFQHLWNRNHPEAPLVEDGEWGPHTQAALRASPANGFPTDGCTAAPPDADGDGAPQGMDCDDHDANRHPGLVETCDAIDNDCDTRIDESVSRTCGSDMGACHVGNETCTAGAWSACIGGVAATDESCDTLDNDCDGTADEDRVCDDEDATLAALVLARVTTDVNGDGRADACMRSPAGFACLTSTASGFAQAIVGPVMADEAGWDERAFYTSVRMGDVDGDGHDDVCARDGEHVVCWGGSTVGFTSTVLTMPLGEPSPEARAAEIWLADVTGDGDVDVCVRDVDGLRCQPRTGRALELDALSDEDGWADVTRHGSIRFGDVDGDGDDDVCARAATGLTCWRAEGTGFDTTPIAGPAWTDALGWSEPRYGSTIRLVDVDGDERADVCGRGPRGLECWLTEETAFATRVRGPAMQGESWDARSVYATIRMGDLDGDRDSDVCARTSDGVVCWLFADDGFEREMRGPALTDADGWDAAARYGSIRLADVSGDGRSDLCARAADGMHCWISDGTSFPRMWIAPSWSDAVGLSDPAFASSLVIGGQGGQHARPRLGGSCSVSVGGRPSGAWSVLLLLGLGLVGRRRR